MPTHRNGEAIRYMISEAESPLSVVAQQSRYLCEKLGNVFDGREAGLHVRNRDVYCSTAPCDIKSIPRLLLHPPHIHPKRPRPCLHQGVPPFSINPWEKPRSSWSRTRSLYTGTATNSDEGNCINTVCVVGYMLVYIYIYIVYFIARLSLFGALLSVADSLFFPFFHFVFWRKR